MLRLTCENGTHSINMNGDINVVNSEIVDGAIGLFNIAFNQMIASGVKQDEAELIVRRMLSTVNAHVPIVDAQMQNQMAPASRMPS